MFREYFQFCGTIKFLYLLFISSNLPHALNNHSVPSAAFLLYTAVWVVLELLYVLTRIDRASLILVRFFFLIEYYILCNLFPLFSVVQKIAECLINRSIIDWIRYISKLLSFLACVVMD